ncbi:MAG: insulinase family protein, partial [bacterium]|nr:insulinase family protein [bacterium]
IYLKTENKKKEEAHQSLKKLITGIYKTGITKDDLAVARVHAKADFLRSCETKEQRARQIAYFEAMGLGFGFLEGFFPAVDRTSLDDLNGYLKKVLNPEQMVEVMIGPGEEK